MNVMGWSVTMPFLQARRDQLHCDATCYGSITSFRSVLEIFGGVFIGKLSDSPNIGRRACLYLGCFANILGLIIGVSMFSIRGLYYCIIPVALLSSSFSVSKALLSDYHESLDISMGEEQIRRSYKHVDCNETETSSIHSLKENFETGTQKGSTMKNVTDRANSMGKLGMSVGLAVMIGPIIGALFVSSYMESAFVASLLNICAALIATKIPYSNRISRPPSTNRAFLDRNAKNQQFIPDFLMQPGPLLLMATRFFMVLAFYIFQTIWVPSLKQRFNFGPKDHGYFMSFVGLSYAFSLGYIAKYVISKLSKRQQRPMVLVACCIILGFGRCLAFMTERLLDIYIIFFVLIVALGIMNTIMNVDASDLVSSAQAGTLFGILESIESAAGIVGPILGGMLSLWKPLVAPLTAVVMCYVVVFCLVLWGYDRFVLAAGVEIREQSQQQQELVGFSNESMLPSDVKHKRSVINRLDPL